MYILHRWYQKYQMYSCNLYQNRAYSLLSLSSDDFIILFYLAGNKCVVYDAVFHPDTYQKGQQVWTY